MLNHFFMTKLKQLDEKLCINVDFYKFFNS